MSPASALLGALVASLWQVTGLAVAFALLRLGTRSPRVRYAAALVTLALQLAWPLWTWVRLLHLELAVTAPETLETSGRWAWVPMAWAAGVAVMLGRTTGGLLVVRAQVARSEPPPPALVERLEAVRAKLAARAVRWAVTARVQVPQTVGFLRPVVFIPLSLLTAVPGGDLELLVAHELMHVRRWDYLVNLGQALVEAVLFFHPAMWWVSRCARVEREYCCDDGVVALLGGARPYASALLSLEESLAPVAVAVPSTGGDFVNRIRRILGANRTSSSLLFALPLVGLIAVTAALAISMRSPPDPVVVAPPELVPALKTLCADLRADALKPEVAKVGPEDLLTVVLADLGEANPHFETFVGQVAKLPAPQRRDAFKRSVSQALGAQWQCADFDALWDNRGLAP